MPLLGETQTMSFATMIVAADGGSRPVSDMLPIAAFALVLVIVARCICPNAGPDDETWTKLAVPWSTTGPTLKRVIFWLLVCSLCVMMLVGLVASLLEKR